MAHHIGGILWRSLSSWISFLTLIAIIIAWSLRQFTLLVLLTVFLGFNFVVTFLEESLSIACIDALRRFIVVERMLSKPPRASESGWRWTATADLRAHDTVFLNAGTVVCVDVRTVRQLLPQPLLAREPGDALPRVHTEGSALRAGTEILAGAALALVEHACSRTGDGYAGEAMSAPVPASSESLATALGPLSASAGTVRGALVVLCLGCLVAIVVGSPWFARPFVDNLLFALAVALAALPLSLVITAGLFPAVALFALPFSHRSFQTEDSNR